MQKLQTRTGMVFSMRATVPGAASRSGSIRRAPANFQSGQLESLAQLGITSINLNAMQESVNSNGNTIVADSSFTYANGTTGDIAGVDLTFDPNTVQGASGDFEHGPRPRGGSSSASAGSEQRACHPATAPGAKRGLRDPGHGTGAPSSLRPDPSRHRPASSSSDASPQRRPRPTRSSKAFNAAGQLSFDQIYDAMSGALKETDQYQYNANGKADRDRSVRRHRRGEFRGGNLRPGHEPGDRRLRLRGQRPGGGGQRPRRSSRLGGDRKRQLSGQDQRRDGVIHAAAARGLTHSGR